MMTTRALKTIGASFTAVTLLFVAGCSSDEQDSPETSATKAEGDSSDDSTSPAKSEESEAETSEDMDFSELLDGITYKGEEVVAQSPEEIEAFIQALKKIEDVDNFEFDPPECADDFKASEAQYIAEKMSPKTFTIGDVRADGLTVVAYHQSVTKDPLGDDVDRDLDKCKEYSFTSPMGTTNVTIEKLPLASRAEKGYAILQRIDYEGQPLDVYNTLVEENGVLININLTVPTEENIKAAEETMNMILERL